MFTTKTGDNCIEFIVAGKPEYIDAVCLAIKIFAEDKFLHGLGLGLPPETEVLLKLKNAGVPVKGRGLSLKAAVNEILEVVI